MDNYSRVRLLTDRFQTEGGFCSDVGYIIEVYPDNNYEVEFSDSDGITTPQIVVSEEELRSFPEA